MLLRSTCAQDAQAADETVIAGAVSVDEGARSTNSASADKRWLLPPANRVSPEQRLLRDEWAEMAPDRAHVAVRDPLLIASTPSPLPPNPAPRWRLAKFRARGRDARSRSTPVVPLASDTTI